MSDKEKDKEQDVKDGQTIADTRPGDAEAEDGGQPAQPAEAEQPETPPVHPGATTQGPV